MLVTWFFTHADISPGHSTWPVARAELGGDPSHQMQKVQKEAKNRLASLTAASLTGVLRGSGKSQDSASPGGRFWAKNFTSTVAGSSRDDEFFTSIRHHGVFQGHRAITLLLVTLLWDI